MVFQLVYSSRAAAPIGRTALMALLEDVRRRNTERGVTGMLLYRDGRFLQLLEGAEDEVRSLYASIAVDPRHTDIAVLAEGRRVLRQFPGWSMTFRDLAEEPIPRPGYTALFDEAVESVQWAVDELVGRMRPSGPDGRPVIRMSRVLGR